jgi:superfamily II DNA or RNA helicase/HKD family nuclease
MTVEAPCQAVSVGSNGDELSQGLYEALLTARLEQGVSDLSGVTAEIAAVDNAEQPGVLGRHVGDLVARRLLRETDPSRRLALVNALVVALDVRDEAVADPARRLLSLTAPAAPGIDRVSTRRPSTPLSDAALLTNAHGDPALGNELRAEIDSADSVDLLCAFVKWHGLRVLEPELRRLKSRGAPLRVITTTYMGATERAALDRLVRELGAEVRITYDILRTRLHAKAWLFRRGTGFDTAYVGSSNLSRAALLDGVEWNVRLSGVATPSLLAKFEATFASYWADDSYELYDPDTDGDRLDDALLQASGRGQGDRITISLSGLEVVARPHQRRILEALETERTVHDRHRNLVVAATGTGKTVVAALDYRRLARQWGGGTLPSLLFVAHRKEILEQSLRTYREVLGDANFGELYVGGVRPERWKHVFASVQSLSSYGVDQIPSGAFDVVVVDEFHHAEAPTYRRIIDHLEPRELLGLTATPERADGTDVRVSYFEGRAACELRLWEALEDDLLVPFHYFGIADGTDLSAIEWKRGRYDEVALSELYTGNEARARVVLRQLGEKVTDVAAMRALGFCVSVDHARYMADVFNAAGIPALAVSGETRAEDRVRALQALRDGKVNVLFAADLFNEGLDLPDVDTVLFLRPTESATIFLQQLGRGLRKTEDKAVLTVLDFVGHHRKDFRFDQRYRALTGATRRGLAHQVERGFPFLPSGCQIILDEQTSAAVLANIKAQLTSRWAALQAELRRHPTQHLATFLADSGTELADVVRSDRSWAGLRRAAGLDVQPSGALEQALARRVRAFAHVDDPDRAEYYLRWLSDDSPDYDAAGGVGQAFGRMLFFTLWPDGGGFGSYAEGLASLRSEPVLRDDLSQVIELGFRTAEHVTHPLTGELADRPLRVHARYTREEAVTALDYVRLGGRRPNSFREGVMFSAEANADAFFVTLKKSESDYSPTTMYRDYAVSPTLFHWESQSVTSIASPTGQRYLNHRELGSHILLFSRNEKESEFGSGAPYLFLGPARYVSHRGERPIAITWQLEYPMPADAFTEASVVA